MTTDLTKDIWNNFIAIPFNKNKSHNFSVRDLKIIIEKHLGKEEVKKHSVKLDFEYSQNFLTHNLGIV